MQGQATLPLSTVSGSRPPPSTWRRLLGSSRWSRNLAGREGFSLVSAQTVFLPLPQPVLPPQVCLPDDRHVASILVPGPEKTAGGWCPGREDLERWLFINSHASAARHPLGAVSAHPGTWASRALAAQGSGRRGGGSQSTLPQQATRWEQQYEIWASERPLGGESRVGSGRKEPRMLANVYKALTLCQVLYRVLLMHYSFFKFIFGWAGSSLLCMGLSLVAASRGYSLLRGSNALFFLSLAAIVTGVHITWIPVMS